MNSKARKAPAPGGLRDGLDLSPREMRSLTRAVEQWVIQYYRSAGHSRVFPAVHGKALRRSLREKLPRSGSTIEEVFESFDQKIAANSRNNLHPRFFGYVSGSANPVAAFADGLCSALNQNVTAWRSAPSAVELELVVIEWMKEILGYPKRAFGLLTSGGSMATLSALAMARTAAAGLDVVTAGVQSLGGKRLRMYASDQSHMSVTKAAELLGLGRDSVRMLESDPQFHLCPDQLDRQIEADRKRGDLPMCVVASAGTVNTGAIDPLNKIADVCKKHNVWLHVDGAYGGFAALSAPMRKKLRGIERADSVSLDPHKWLYQPLDVGCLLVRDGRHARATFSGSIGEYTRVYTAIPDERFAFFEHGIDLSRRMRSLKVWMTFKYYGADRIARCIERNIEAARYMQSLIEASDELELLAPAGMSIFCFRYVPIELREKLQSASPAQTAKINKQLDALNQRLMTELQHGGVAYLSNAVLRGKFALRGCIVGYRTRREDLDITRDEVLKHGRKIWLTQHHE